MSIGVPIKVLHEAEGHIVTCETNTGEVYRGKLIEAEDNMNCQMSNITVTYRDGRVAQLEQVYIRGSKIRFLILPDMLKNAPMLKSMKNKNQGSGAGRGKAAILKAQVAARGRGRGMGRGNIFQKRVGSQPSRPGDFQDLGVARGKVVMPYRRHERQGISLPANSYRGGGVPLTLCRKIRNPGQGD